MGVGISLSRLSSAVADEGGIGVIATAGIGMTEIDSSSGFLAASKRALRQEIRKAREATKGILGVNIMAAMSNFEDVVQTFLLGTYFDYYLLRYHEDDELSPSQAARVHEAADRALAMAHVDVLAALFRKVAANMISAGLYIPRIMWDLAAAALRGEDEAAQIEYIEDSRGLLARAVDLLEQELADTRRVTVEAICEGFDHAWKHGGGSGTELEKTEQQEQSPERIQ